MMNAYRYSPVNSLTLNWLLGFSKSRDRPPMFPSVVLNHHPSAAVKKLYFIFLFQLFLPHSTLISFKVKQPSPDNEKNVFPDSPYANAIYFKIK